METKFRIEQKLTNEVFNSTDNDRLYLDTVMRFIQDLPINKVKKLFNLEILKGTKEEYEEALKEYDKDKAEEVYNLIQLNQSVIKGTITI